MIKAGGIVANMSVVALTMRVSTAGMRVVALVTVVAAQAMGANAAIAMN